MAKSIFGLLPFFALFISSAANAGTAIETSGTQASTIETATATTTLEISGWLPYWRKASSTAEALVHLDAFKEINPFAFSVKRNGMLVDNMQIGDEPWVSLIQTAKAKKIRVIPTVMWSDGAAMDKVLRNPTLRQTHINQIVKMVKSGGFDGVDIDYEAKLPKTKPYFSLFLKQLYNAMGKKWVMCSIEARTPPDSLFEDVPKTIQYANDFSAINKYCDRVRIMTYDQGSIDLKLNAAISGPYVPVSDPRWVEKVLNLAAETISKKKLVIGIPTYGYEYEVMPRTEGYSYDLLWSFNQNYALDLASKMGIAPERNAAGEVSFSYKPMSQTVPSGVATDTTFSNNPESASSSLSILTMNVGSTSAYRIVWWSDAAAIKDKINLARKLGVRGVAIFKIDGGADPAMWNILK